MLRKGSPDRAELDLDRAVVKCCTDIPLTPVEALDLAPFLAGVSLTALVYYRRFRSAVLRGTLGLVGASRRGFSTRLRKIRLAHISLI